MSFRAERHQLMGGIAPPCPVISRSSLANTLSMRGVILVGSW